MLTIEQIYQPKISYLQMPKSRFWGMLCSDVFGIHMVAFFYRLEYVFGELTARKIINSIRHEIEQHHQIGIVRYNHLTHFCMDNVLSLNAISSYLQSLDTIERDFLLFTLYSGYSLEATRSLTWNDIDCMWHMLSPVIQDMINLKIRNTHSNRVFSTALPRGYIQPQLINDDIIQALGVSHRSLVASFSFNSLAQSNFQSPIARTRLGINDI